MPPPGGRGEWTVLHTDAILTNADELYFLNALSDQLPYGVALWPSALALAHEVATRADAFRGRTVLELGAGLGWVYLSGFVAWLAWLFIHILYLMAFENRMLVLFQWAWNYFTRNRSARLITGGYDGRSAPGCRP